MNDEEATSSIGFWTIVTSILLPWLLAEIAFGVVFYRVWLPRFQQLRPPEDYRDYARDRRQLLIRILLRLESTCRSTKTPLLPTIRAYVREWFHPIDCHHHHHHTPEGFWPRKGDMDQFFAWAFFGSQRGDLEDWMLKDMDRMYETMKAKYGLEFEEGMTPHMKPMRLTLDPLEPSYRPCFVYGLFSLLILMKGLLLRAAGFYFCRTSTGLRYWYRPEKKKSDKLPLLFLHGIAPGGLAFYLPMLFFLGRDGRPLLFFENPGISFGIHFENPPNAQDTTAGVWEAVDQHLGPNRHVSVVGHSFGTCPITWLIHHSALKHRIRQIVLVDPVSILLSEPDVMTNFLYQRKALEKRSFRIGVVSNEIFTEHYLRRHFSWYNSELWLEDLPPHAKVLVCLSAQDPIVPAQKVHREVMRGKPDVDVLVWENAGHAHCVTRPRTWRQIQLVMKRQEQIILQEATSSKDM
jgi:pimeloyl-ACP methyl ester carboxylesterase